LIIFDNFGIVEKLKRDSRYVHLGRLSFENNKIYLNPINTKVDEITAWDREINIFKLSF